MHYLVFKCYAYYYGENAWAGYVVNQAPVNDRNKNSAFRNLAQY